MISGAGPAVIVLTDIAHADHVMAAVQAFEREHPGQCTFAPANLPIAHTGVIVESLR